MTVIVAVKHYDGTVYMGADSLAIVEGRKAFLAQPKITRIGPMLLGFAGNAKSLSTVFYETKEDIFSDFGEYTKLNKDISQWIHERLIPVLRKGLLDKGFMGVDKPHEAQLLIALDGSIFSIHGELEYVEYNAGYAAIGSGRDLALGALYYMSKYSPALHPLTKIREAIEAASKFDYGVGGDIRTLSTENDTVYEEV